MKYRLISKIISAIIVAVILNCAFYRMNLHHAVMGREAYMAQQAARYDRIMVSPSFTHYLIPSLFMLGIMFVMYEFFAFAICKFLDKMFMKMTPSAPEPN
jgi:hypothetical protein